MSVQPPASPPQIGQYLASGRPIVTTAVGEMPRYFDDGVTAFMCAPGDPRVYGERIADLLSDPGLAAAVGSSAGELCRRTFDFRIHGETLAALMATLTARPAASRACSDREGAHA